MAIEYERQHYSSGSYSGVQIVDLDRDGKLDVVTGHRDPMTLEVWRYDFAAASLKLDYSIQFPFEIHDFQLADFDRDGDLDAAAGTRFGGLYYAQNNGAQQWPVGALDDTYSWRVQVADFDNDGNLDILDGVDTEQGLKILYGDGGGGFAFGDAPEWGGRGLSVNAVDLNGDGRTDIIGMKEAAGPGDTNALRAFLNLGNREWSDSVGPSTPFSDFPLRTQAEGNVTAADVDRNGYIDQVAAQYDQTVAEDLITTDLIMFKGGASQGQPVWTPTLLDTLPGRQTHVGFADINDDGNLDVYAGWQGSQILSIYLGDGRGGFRKDLIDLADKGPWLHQLATGDINDDGTTDVYIANGQVGLDPHGFQLLLGIGQGEPIAGTSGNDVLTGTSRPESIRALAGDDIVEGLAGADSISGASGRDLVSAGDGADSVWGGPGDDDLLGGNDDDTIDGGRGRDRLLGEGGDDSLLGRKGADILVGGDQDDLLDGGRGYDHLNGGRGNDRLDGGRGADTLIGTDPRAAADGDQATSSLRIVSDGTWVSSDVLSPGWELVSFDDSAWVPARSPYPGPHPDPPTDLIPGTTGRFIWHDPQGTSDGSEGPDEVFLRKTFDLDLRGGAQIAAVAQVWVDDDHLLYVNGVLASEDKSGGAGPVEQVNIAPYLRDGANVIAIHAVDGTWGFPYDRLYEDVLFDATIAISGAAEIDTLIGGQGPDTFVLGDKDHAYYAIAGENDYARIADLRGGDVIQLHGKAEDYTLDPDFRIDETDGTGIFLEGAGEAAVDVMVPGTSDPWLSGMPDGTIDGTDSAPAQSPVEAAGLTLDAGDVLTFTANGGVAQDPNYELRGPDGNAAELGSHGPQYGMSHLRAPYDALVGVFLGLEQPDLTPPPGDLDFASPGSRDYLSISPALDQPFFVGDGLTSAGDRQQVIVPEGATRLFLGVLDTVEWQNNIGTFSVQVADLGGSRELVGFVEGDKSLDLTSSDFSFA